MRTSSGALFRAGEDKPFHVYRQTMRRHDVYVLWHGGSSYAAGDWKDLEVIDGLAQARARLDQRYFDRFRQSKFDYVFRHQCWVGTPGVDTTSHFQVWFGLDIPTVDPGHFELPEPDRYVIFGRNAQPKTVEVLPSGWPYTD